MQQFKDVGSMIVHQAEIEIIVEDISRTQTHQYSYVRFIGTLNNSTLCPLICILILIEQDGRSINPFQSHLGIGFSGRMYHANDFNSDISSLMLTPQKDPILLQSISRTLQRTSRNETAVCRFSS